MIVTYQSYWSLLSLSWNMKAKLIGHCIQNYLINSEITLEPQNEN